MNKNFPIKKLAVSIVAAMLLLCLYRIIFSFSGQDGETSGGLSYMISEKCVDFISNLTGKGWTDGVRVSLAEYFEHPIRKFAHFAEYACMGLLVYTMWRPWKKPDRKLYFLVILWVLLSAAGDEIHQLFVPGRWGSVADVLLDTCGGIFGILCCVTCEYFWLRRRKRKMKYKK